MEPETPVMVTVEVPVGVADGTVRVSVLVEVVGFGLNPAVTPLGIPDALRLTLPLNPCRSDTVMVLVPWLPCWMVSESPLALRITVGLPEQLSKANDEMLVAQSALPFTVWY